MRRLRGVAIGIFCLTMTGGCGQEALTTDDHDGADSTQTDSTNTDSQDGEDNDNETGGQDNPTTDPGSDDFDTSSIADPIGGCVISTASGEVPDNLYGNTGIVETDAYLPFTKVITVRGITLMGRSENEDSFMLKVAQAIEEIFPENDSNLDATLQARVIRSMYERKTVIPLFKGDGDVSFSGNNEEAQFENLQEGHSLCDVIFEYGSEGQTMEVVEHILHHVTMVGLHYTFYDDWGVNRDSEQHQHMQSAISSGYYNADYGSQTNDDMLRVYLQEYAYWVISTAWDVQETYGGDGGGGEWTLMNPDSFMSSQPEMHALYERTAAKVMRAPQADTLAWFQN